MTKKQEFTCQYCGIRVKKYPSQVKGKSFTCGKNCPQKVSGSLLKKCIVCGTEFSTYRSIDQQKCGQNCPGYKQERVCEVCSQCFTWRKGQGAGRFCSNECRLSWFSTNFVEERSPQWRGGISEGKKYSAKRRAIYARGDCIDRFVLFEQYDWMCHLCDLPIDPRLKHPDKYAATIDHLVPISRGGEHVWENVRPAHAMCNFRKSSKLYEDEAS